MRNFHKATPEQLAFRAHLEGYYAGETGDSYPGWLRRQIQLGRAFGRHNLSGHPMDVVHHLLGDRSSNLIDHAFVRRRDQAWIWEPYGIDPVWDLYFLDRLALAIDSNYEIRRGRYSSSTIRIIIRRNKHEVVEADRLRALWVLAVLTRGGSHGITKAPGQSLIPLLDFAPIGAIRKAAKSLDIRVSGAKISISRRRVRIQQVWQYLIDWMEGLRPQLDELDQLTTGQEHLRNTARVHLLEHLLGRGLGEELSPLFIETEPSQLPTQPT